MLPLIIQKLIPMFTKEAANKYITDLLKKHKIKVIAYSTTSCGYAIKKQRAIKIPKPTNVDRFGVCLHEVKHILDGNKGKRYEQEFACDLYALNIMKELDYPTTEWELRMRWHSLSRIAMSVNRGLNIDKIPAEIRDFFKEVDFTTWVGKKVFVSRAKAHPGYSITLTDSLTLNEIQTLLTKRGLSIEKSDCDDSTYGRWIVKPTGDNYGSDFGNLVEVTNHYHLTA